MEAVLFIGIQATGKSEFYKQHYYNTHMRINLDMLGTRNRENIFLNACFAAKQPFVVDNTNPTREDRHKYIELAKQAGFVTKGYYFRSSIKEAIARNEQRTGKARIPLQAMLATHNKLERPSLNEGFDFLYYVYIDNTHYNFITEEYADEI